ncbi:MAG: hypothetical protein ACLFV7_06635 [Phycisphaerae bacterium]
MNKSMLGKLGSIFSLPMAVLLVIFFFLPWVRFQCSNMELFTASGWQLTTGGVTPSKQLEQQKKAQQQADEEMEEEEEGPDARPWYILGLLTPVAILLAGVMGAMGKGEPGKIGAALLICAAVGVLLMIMAANMDYSDEMIEDQQEKQKQQQEEGTPSFGPSGEQMEEMMRAQMKTEATGMVWVSLVLYFLVAAAGAMNLVLPQFASGSSGQPAGAHPGTPPSAPPGE